jgi:uncharacterized protein (DUF1786 family)
LDNEEGLAFFLMEKEKFRMANLEENVSVCPKGEVFVLPADEDYAQEFERLKELVQAQRAMGREIVVVMGVGFVKKRL